MATATTKTKCFSCGKETRTFICEGCSRNFCRNDLTKHLQELGEQFDRIENSHDELRQILNEQKNDPKKHSLIRQINQWEEDSIKKIKQTAEECRQKLMKYTSKGIMELENQLNNLAKQMKDIRQENEFNEIDLKQFKKKLNKLKDELDKPSNVSIKQESTGFINNIFIISPFETDIKWEQVGITVAGGNGDGNRLNQLYFPKDIFLDDDQTIYIADQWNNRIVEWKCNAANGKIVAGGNGKGNQTNQLNWATNVIVDKETNSLFISDMGNRRIIRWFRQNKSNGEIIISDTDCWGLAMDQDGSLYVSNYEKNEVRRWKRRDKEGTIVAGGNGKGTQLNQLDCPTGIFVDADYSVYVSDENNHRVMKWTKNAKEGIVVAGGNGQGDSLTQLSRPFGVIVDQLGQIYVADRDNHRVVRWCEGAKEGMIVVGGNGEGQQSNQLSSPNAVSFDQQGNLYVADHDNHRIQKFQKSIVI